MKSASASTISGATQILADAAKAFEPAGAPQRKGRLERENARLKVLVGELTLELKKSGNILE
jgi:hypothetical protein